MQIYFSPNDHRYNNLMAQTFPCVKMLESYDCGPAALASVARYYGFRLSIETLRDLVGTDLQGSNINRLRDAAQHVGFEAACGRVHDGALDLIPLPAICHTHQNNGHYVVLYQIIGDRMTIADPAQGLMVVTQKQFHESWSGHAVLLKPQADRIAANTRRYRRSAEILTRLIWLEYKSILTSFLLAFAAVLLAFLTSYAIEVIIDRAIPTAKYNLLNVLGLAILSVAIARTIANAVRQVVLARASRRWSNDMADRLVSRVFRQPLQFFDRRTPGDVVTRFYDLNTIQNAVIGNVMSMSLDISLVCIAACLLAVLSKWLFLIVALCFLASGILITVTAKALLHRQRDIRDAMTLTASRIIDSVAAIRLIKAFGVETVMKKRICDAYTMAQTALYSSSLLNLLVNSGCTFCTAIGSLLILFVGARMTIAHSLSVGQIIYAYSLVGFFFSSVEQIVPALGALREALISVERISTLGMFEQETSLSETTSQSPKSHSSLPCCVTISGVSYSYGTNQPVLKDVDISINAGETVALLGATGVGKTTLACLIAGLYAPTAGSIQIDGEHVMNSPNEFRQRQASIVFQDSHLIAGTITENIMFGKEDVDFTEIDAVSRCACIDEVIAQLPKQYDYNVGPHGCMLSGGQRQRIAIARALLRKSPVLILDEVTSNLDPLTERRLMTNLLGLRPRPTMIVITHRMTTARLCGRVCVLHNGSVLEDGRHEELLHLKGKYYDMWNQLNVPVSEVAS
jgi:ATP-binding cassette, subfamily C, bacteriocin exporter